MSQEPVNQRSILVPDKTKRRWQFDVKTLLWWVALAAILSTYVKAIPSENPFSGPLYLLDKFNAASDRYFVYAWTLLMLIGVVAFPAWPRKWTSFVTLGGVLFWIASSLVVRFSIDW